ncbi:MAG: hypothetical protein IPK82_44125 [Polyangiaceae bacterium]|nr:hypothetical protein [Polyangiaceae bacterium]
MVRAKWITALAVATMLASGACGHEQEHLGEGRSPIAAEGVKTTATGGNSAGGTGGNSAGGTGGSPAGGNAAGGNSAGGMGGSPAGGNAAGGSSGNAGGSAGNAGAGGGGDPCAYVVCEDGDPCTVNVCLEDGSCAAFPGNDGASCGPNTECGKTSCLDGICQWDPCDDGNPCTQDACAEGGECSHTPLSDGTECWSASLCGASATCISGDCVAGAPVDCADGNPETADYCDPDLFCQQAGAPNLQPAQVARGAFVTGIKMGDSTVWEVGATPANRLVQVRNAGGGAFNGVFKIAEGHAHALAIKSNDGSVWAWGTSAAGELGTGPNQAGTATPVAVMLAADTPLVGMGDVAAGANTSYALGADGKVRAWGRNAFGQLGDGTRTDRNRPIVVQQLNGGDLTNIVAISAAYFGALGLRDDGTVWAWGANAGGECGDEAPSPWATRAGRIRTVAGAFMNNVTAIAGGQFASIALRSDGTVWAWGDDRQGQLGDRSNAIRARAGQIPGLGQVVEIGAGRQFFFARKQDGSVWAWGRVIGDGRDERNGPPTVQRTPVQIFRPGNQALTAQALSQGPAADHGAVIYNVGFGVWTWGQNRHGQLGDGTRQDRLLPVEMLPP